MQSRIKELHEKRNALVAEQRSFVENTPDADWNEEADATFQRMSAEIAAVEKRKADLEAMVQRDADITAAQAPALDAPAPAAENSDTAQIRSLLRGEQRSITLSGGPAVKRDLSGGTTGAGGATVPISFYDQLVDHMIEVAAVMNAGATVLRTTSGEKIQVPVTTAHSSGALVAAGAPISESDPVFAQRDLDAFKYGVMVQVQRELIEDTAVDLLGYLAMQAGRAVGNAFGAHLATGTGSSQPAGIITDATVGVTGATGVTGAFTADNLIDLYYSVIAPYRMSPQAAWLMDDTTVAAVRKLKDANDQYLWVAGLSADQPDMLLGKPIITDPNIATPAVGAKSVLFGDISRYMVRMVNDVRFERSDEFAFGNDLVSFRCLVRGDGVLADQTGAVKVFQGGAS